MHTKEPEYLDDIVSRLFKSDWTIDEATHFHRLLTNMGVDVPDVNTFFKQVHDHFDVFDARMDNHFGII